MRSSEGRPLRTVWILGAGFSKSLGGPLLNELLKPQDLEDLRLLYPEGDYPKHIPDLIFGAQQFFRYGREVEGQWENAEQYISFLEEAASIPDGSSAGQLESLAKRFLVSPGRRGNTWHTRAKGLAAMAKRALAADCSRFIRGAQISSERWAPYRSWMNDIAQESTRPIGGSHTVVSFNYDIVLECVSGSGHEVVVGKQPQYSDRIPIFKIHGSVNWRMSAAGIAVAANEEALVCEDDQIAIAVPGPAKQLFSSERWKAAEDALEKAEAIVFLGYRFPETDADARLRILGSLARSKQSHVAIHVVLGPDIGHRDPLRVRMLIATALRRRRQDARLERGRHENSYSLTVHPLFAEDFLCLYSQVGLLGQEFEGV